MATADITTPMLRSSEESVALAGQLRRLARVATIVAVLTSPAAYFFFRHQAHLSVGKSILVTLLVVIGFRGLVDLFVRRLIPWPSLFGTEDARLREEDVVNRRRAWTWRFYFRVATIFASFITIAFLYRYFTSPAGTSVSWLGSATHYLHKFGHLAQSGAFWMQFVVVFFLFLANFLIFMGPMMLMGISQIRGYEPGDAEWGVKLDDVRGQAEAKEEVRRIVTLWQSGEAFERAGGKRERGLLFNGAPGTGKTMLAKAIATGFNSPFVTIPGSGFAQTFIGIDAIIVRFLARKSKKLANKWGGQCIVFIDEIDAVGMRRQSLGSGFQPLETGTIHDSHFFGPLGAVTSSGDLVVETEAWREKLFRMRAEPARQHYPAVYTRLARGINNAVIPGMMGGMGGGLALNQLLVVMDGIDDPPLLKRFRTRKFNTFLDALYFVPPRLFGRRLRLKPPKPRKEEVYFIGACNVLLEMLDPALTRPGRMGRHIHFRTPTWEDRRDIFDLYLGKVSHESDLDTPKARDELARITNGYSPAMIDQACSLALTYAHSDDRIVFSRRDLVEAMTTVESGVAIGQPYPKHEERATAIHEAGHAVCGHLYMENLLSTRLSIRKRGSSGGHHQAMAIEDRFGSWRSEEVGELIWVLGAMAAEIVFYGQNTNGVGGDLGSATGQAALMVGAAGMAPAPIDLSDRVAEREEREADEKKVVERFERLGEKIMHRSSGMSQSMWGAALGDGAKRKLASGL